MKTLTAIAILILSTVVHGVEVRFSQQELCDILAPAIADGACSEAIVACLDYSSKSTCTTEVEKLARGKCGEFIPAEGGGQEITAEVSGKMAEYVVSEIMETRKSMMEKNIMTPACQSFTK